MRQKISSRLNYVLVLSSLMFLTFSCKESSNPVNNEETFAISSQSVTPIKGGTIELTNKNGDKIELIIPPYAVMDTTKITLEVLNDIKPNPFSQNILSTIRILPDGLKLDSAATLKVTFATTIADTSFTILYYRKQNDLAFPLKTRWINNKIAQGNIYHFSEYGSATVNGYEVVTYSQGTNAFFDPWNWQEFYTFITSLLQYYEMLIRLGLLNEAEALSEKINQRIIDHVNAFLDLPVPEEPCGYYLQTLLKYSSMVFSMVSNEQLEQRITDRLNETLNRCYIRGELEFDYQYCASAEGSEICRTITGFVPFTVNTTVEPHGQINGSGTLVWNGTMSGLPSDCFYIETGAVSVNLGGEMVIDEFGVPWMDFEIAEHASGTITAGCEGIPPQTYPFNPPDVNHQIRLLAENNTELIMPIPGASSGSFKWTLHLTVNN